MKAKVIKPFPGARDGEVHPHNWEKGDTVEGDLAEVAVANGWAEELPEDQQPAKSRKPKA